MDQQRLWHESLEDALRDAVYAIGGPKKVGGALWPGKGLEDAARYLNHTLDAERNEKLSCEEILWIMRAAHEVGCHTVIAFLAKACGYSQPTPIQPQDEAVELHKQLSSLLRDVNEGVDRLEKLMNGNPMRVIK